MSRRHIVVIRPGALGDTLLTFPALALVRRVWPDAHLTLVARSDTLALAVASGLAHAGSPYDAPAWSALFAAEPARQSPAHAALAGSLAIAWLADPDGLVARNLRALEAAPVFVAPARPTPDVAVHTALWLAQSLRPLDIAVPETLSALVEALPSLQPSEADRCSAARVWATLEVPDDHTPVIALHPGSGGAAKRWLPASFAALARTIRKAGAIPLLVEGPQDAPVIRDVLASTEYASVAPLVARDLSVGMLAGLLTRCTAFVGNDSGVTHLAALLGVPTLALFGPSEPAHWAPLGHRADYVRAATSRMADLRVEGVWQALRSLAPHYLVRG